jgi:hypothetical protein
LSFIGLLCIYNMQAAYDANDCYFEFFLLHLSLIIMRNCLFYDKSISTAFAFFVYYLG